MRVLGIDPGTIRMGYGVVEERDGGLTLIQCGVLRAPSREPMERRLWRLFQKLQGLVRDCRPNAIAVEEPFVVQAPRNSAMAVGEARAVALLAAAGHRLPVAQYTPTKVRSTVADYGSGDKDQVRLMVSLLVHREADELPLDASDAIAVAICHLRHAAFDGVVGAQEAAPQTRRRAASRRRDARR